MNNPARQRLWKTASAIALCGYLSVPVTIRAEEPKIVLELHGGWLGGDEQAWSEFFDGVNPPILNTVAPDNTFGGTVGFISPLGNFVPGASEQWDVGVFARFGRSNSETNGGYGTYFYNVIGGFYPSSYTTASVEHHEEHAIVDFEARKDVGLGTRQGDQFQTTIGARFGFFNATTETNLYYSPAYILTDNRESQFIGAGPRVGLEGSFLLTDNLYLDVSAGASVLFGRMNVSNVTVGGLPPIGNSFHFSRFDLVSMLEGRLGLSFMMPEYNTKISLGVEASGWFGVYDQLTTGTLAGPPAGTINADRFRITPYVRMTMPFGSVAGVDHASSSHGTSYSPHHAIASPEVIFQAGIYGGYTSRAGDALNLSAGVPDEADEYGHVGGDLLFATPLNHAWMSQLEADGEVVFANDTPAPTDDSYSGGYTAGGHLAYTRGPLLLGIFGGFGHTGVETIGVVDQSADHWFVGGEGRYITEYGSLSVQAGLLESRADDPETVEDAIFGQLTSKVFLEDGNTLVEGNLGYLTGVQDSDAFFFSDPVEVVSWGAKIEKQLDWGLQGMKTSAFVSYSGLYVLEKSSAGAIDDLLDNTISIGLNFRSGGMTLLDREYNSAPRLPQVHRWVGSIPAVD